MRVTPSQGFKKRLDKSLFFINLVHYSALRKVLSLVIITAIVTGITFLGINNNNNPKPDTIAKIAISDKTIKSSSKTSGEKVNLSSNYNVSGDISAHSENPANATDDKLNNNTSANLTKNTYTQLDSKNTNGKTNDNVNKEFTPGIYKNKENEVSKNEAPKVGETDKANENKPGTNTPKPLVAEPLQNQTVNHLNDKKESPFTTNNNNNNVSENKIELQPITEKTIQNINDQNKSFIMKGIVSLPPKDTITNYLGQKIVVKPVNWTLGAYWDAHFNSSKINSQNSETQIYTDMREAAMTKGNSFSSFGFNITMHTLGQGIIFQTGLAYTTFTETYNYKELLEDPSVKYIYTRNNNTYNYSNGGHYYMVDTTGGYYHYTYELTSHIMVVDSNWVYNTTTTPVDIYDSTKTKAYDTLKNVHFTNTYSYLEIPLIIGYHFEAKNFDFAIKGGIIGGYLLQATGNMIALDDSYDVTAINQELPFRKIVFSGIVSASANYTFSKRWSIYLEPYYRQNINSILAKNSQMSQRLIAYGIKTGILYKF
jgi:hypothetical protein